MPLWSRLPPTARIASAYRPETATLTPVLCMGLAAGLPAVVADVLGTVYEEPKVLATTELPDVPDVPLAESPLKE